ncbi:hypothetical protein JOC95_002033 [Bacillus tianshenii]|uniref:ABC-three component systems C-terminal domain-containing protein n=1 Tax=Sutcliffiella tianshenii TaxID=1463404 RepID=A0ABS2P171_9BACI|nr:ABC-three component system protein [Bacillus tianshenii]MBM7620180.1 hypothetical protein [Bacillus tianshenii]
MTNPFSAGSSAVGYLYQIRYALLMIMKKHPVDISIENLDDIEFEREGTPIELLQLKHHSSKRPANLTDSSSDLWKSIRIWSEAIKNSTITVPGVIFSLITTSKASSGSLVSLLKADRNRDSREAHIKLLEHIKHSTGEGNKPAYEAFLSLEDNQQYRLVDSIYVLDQEANIVDLVKELKNELKFAAKPEHIDPLYERLEGWWFEKSVSHLFFGSNETIKGSDVQKKIQEIRDQLKPDSLPIDFATADTPNEFSGDKRIFVEQLKVLSLKDSRINRAIRDFYRASSQRAKWVDEQLISMSELEDYERKLMEFWEEEFDILNEDISDYSDEELLERLGRDFYNNVMKIPYLNIRNNVTERYVMVGSFHILADHIPFRLGWHPTYKDKLAYLYDTKGDDHEQMG